MSSTRPIDSYYDATWLYPRASSCERSDTSPFVKSLPLSLTALFARFGLLYLLESPRVKGVLVPIHDVRSAQELKSLCLTASPCVDIRAIETMALGTSLLIKYSPKGNRIVYTKEHVMAPAKPFPALVHSYAP